MSNLVKHKNTIMKYNKTLVENAKHSITHTNTIKHNKDDMECSKMYHPYI